MIRETDSAESGASVSQWLSGAGDPRALHPSTRNAAITAGRDAVPRETRKAIVSAPLVESIAILVAGSHDADSMAMVSVAMYPAPAPRLRDRDVA